MIAPFRLENFYADWEFNAKYNVSASDAETMSVSELLGYANDEDRKAWEELTLGYRPVEGDGRLRELIAQTYDTLEADDILCFAGAEEGIWCAMHALLTSSDHAIVTTPNYQSWESIPLSITTVTGVRLREEHGWAIDLDELEHALRPQTKLIAVNFPNNPTGAVADRATFDTIIRIAAERDLYLFSDEVYRGVERDPSQRLPQAADLYERGISLGVMSKAYGMPGLRIGWIACRDRDLLAEMGQLKHYLSICNAGPSEILARIALNARERVLARTTSIVVNNLEQLRTFFGARRDLFSWHEPRGGCVGFPKYLGADGVEAFCRRLLKEHGILLAPGSLFRSELQPVPSDHFRIGFGRRSIERTLPVLTAAIEF